MRDETLTKEQLMQAKHPYLNNPCAEIEMRNIHSRNYDRMAASVMAMRGFLSGSVLTMWGIMSGKELLAERRDYLFHEKQSKKRKFILLC